MTELGVVKREAWLNLSPPALSGSDAEGDGWRWVTPPAVAA